MGPIVICPGTEYTYTSLENGIAYSWQVTGGTTSSNSGKSIKIKWGPTGGNITLMIRMGKGEGERENFLDASPYNGGRAYLLASVCPSANGSMELREHLGKVKRWERSTDNVNWTQINHTGTLLNFSTTQSCYYRAVVGDDNCERYSQAGYVSLLPIPEAPVANSSSGCAGTMVALSASGSGSSYRWYNKNRELITGATSKTFTTERLYTSTTYYVSTVNSSGCESPLTAVMANIYAFPSIPPATLVKSCGSTQITLATPPAGFTFHWYKQDDPTINSSNTNTLATTSTIVMYSMKAGTYCRSDAAGQSGISQLVTVNEVPTVIPTTYTQYCGGGILNTLQPPEGVLYYLQASANGTDQSFSGTRFVITQSGTYYIRPYNVQGQCWGSSTETTINYDPLSCLDNQDKNYIVTQVIQKEGVTNETQLKGLQFGDVIQQVSYIDGLGRLIQKVNTQSSPSRKDLIQPFSYDAMGRQQREFLPYTGSFNGRYQENWEQQQAAFYTLPNAQLLGHASTTKPSSDKKFDNSPLGFVSEQGHVGETWQLNTDHINKQRIIINTANQIRLWKYDELTDKISSVNYYQQGTLSGTETTNEQGWKKESYNDRQGKLILERREINQGEYTHTYYVYDSFSRLRVVIQPQGMKELEGLPSNQFPDAAFMDKFTFRYKYDKHGRMTEKKVPGAAAIYYVYNKRNQSILSQDGEQRKKNEWSFSKYDGLGRVIQSGIYTHSSFLDQAAMQALANNISNQFETRTTTNYGYSLDRSFPILSGANYILLTISYYDDYDYDNNSVSDAIYQTSGMNPEPIASTNTINKLTGSRTRILGTAQMLLTSLFYDSEGNLIQQQQQNQFGGTNLSTNRYDFTGKMLQSINQQSGGTPVKVNKRYSYDQAGRLTKITHQINQEPEVNLANYYYNELGQQISRMLHIDSTGNYLQKVDYQYNIRGWLSSINGNPETNDLFTMTLEYDNPSRNDAIPFYNGKISQLSYSDKMDNKTRGYVYNYDGLDRMKVGKYAQRNNSGHWVEQIGSFDESLNYDYNGNIVSLTRNGQLAGQTQRIDDLVYEYNGNQLKTVEDNETQIFGFINATSLPEEYTYDASGNQITDSNKGIISITYNFLNLPEVITIKDKGIINYRYDATGRKLSKSVTPINGISSTRYYENGYEYNQDKQLQHFTSEEGRVVRNTDNIYNYQYNLKDHLGNSRISFDLDPTTQQTRIIQKDSYYPFGQIQNGGFVSGNENKYKYNDKEIQDELGLNWYDYGARFYNAELARWTSIDPMADKYLKSSPYNYVDNNPISRIDPDGKEWWNSTEEVISPTSPIPRIDLPRIPNNITHTQARQLANSHPKEMNQYPIFSVAEDMLDSFQDWISLAGMTPVIGDVADATNVLISSIRGNKDAAAWSTMAMITPFFSPKLGRALTLEENKARKAMGPDNWKGYERLLAKEQKELISLEQKKLNDSGMKKWAKAIYEGKKPDKGLTKKYEEYDEKQRKIRSNRLDDLLTWIKKQFNDGNLVDFDDVQKK